MMSSWLRTVGAGSGAAVRPLQRTTLSTTSPLLQTLSPCRFWSSDSGAKRREKVPVELREEDLEEQFVKGWGKGGQKINKVRNCVLLKHVPTGLHIRCQETRSLDGNRRTARKLLIQKLDDQLNGELSKRNVKIDKLRRKKASKRNKSKQKYAAHKASGDAEQDEDEDEDEEGDEENDDDEEESDDDDEEEEEEEEEDVDPRNRSRQKGMK